MSLDDTKEIFDLRLILEARKAEIADMQRQLRESQTREADFADRLSRAEEQVEMFASDAADAKQREAEQVALNGKLREALAIWVEKLHKSPLQRFYYIGKITVEDLDALLSLTPSQALRGLKAQVLRDAADHYASYAEDVVNINRKALIQYWREQADALENKVKGE